MLLVSLAPLPSFAEDEDEVEFKGFIESLPADGLVGNWVVGGQVVVVTPSTELEDEDAPFVIGACAEVEGKAADGSIVADEISTHSPSECGGFPGVDDAGNEGVGEAEFNGLIDALPAMGSLGQWVIDGRTVLVTEYTELETEEGAFVVGACVEVEGFLLEDGVVQAEEIEIEEPEECTGGGSEVEFSGPIQELPLSGPLGDWLVGGILVRVLPTTEVEQERGPAALGSCVAVEGRRGLDGIVVAEEIEVRSSSGGCALGDEEEEDDSEELEFYGVIQRLPPGGLLGAWLIGGRTVLVGSSTEIDFDGLPAAVGVCVEAEGFLLNGGVIQAESIETEDSGGYCGSGSDTPGELEFKGFVEALPAGGLLGPWQVGGLTLFVVSGTEFEAEDGPFAVGACVSVEARLLPDGSLEASEIQTEEDPSECDGAPGDENEFEFRGLVQAVPGAGLFGNWTIAFLGVVVNESTEIEEDHGPLVPGACVDVEARLGTGGILTAKEIEVVSSSGTCLSAEGVVDGAAFTGGAVAPGQIVSLFGFAVGSLDSRSLQVRDDRLASELSNTRVLFDGVPAPLILVSVNQINAVVPYSADGKTQIQMQIERAGGWSNVVTVPVVGASPGLFTLTQTGKGQAAALNFEADDESFTLNGASNRVERGGIVVLYGTGGGQTEPAGTDGLVIEGTLPRPRRSVSVSIGGEEGEVLYAGAAPGFVSGLLQINARVPMGIAASPSAPVTVGIGGFSSQPGVTVAVR